MSRIGKQPVTVPAGVKVRVADGKVFVEGPKGKLELAYHRNMKVEFDEAGKAVRVSRPDDERQNRALHGLTRSLVANMVEGVVKGYEKRLKIEGIGYQARKEKNGITLTVGYANAITMLPPEGVTAAGRPDDDHRPRPRQAEGRPVRGRGAGRAQAGAVQGQGHPLRERTGAPQGRQVLHQRRLIPRPPAMNPQKAKAKRQLRRRHHVRRKITGTPERPRLTVFRSSKHIYAQLIDDLAGVTLAAASSLTPEVHKEVPYGGNIKAAKAVGQKLAAVAK
jgi:large subunit ribosomal protein L6